jgi:DNA-binding CsgD family transcriptional regulator
MELAMLNVIEALYDLEAPRAKWLLRIAEECARAFPRQHVGAYALEYDASDPDAPRFGPPALYRVESEAAARLLRKDFPVFYRRNPDIVDAVFRHVGFAALQALPHPERIRDMRGELARAGVAEILGINGVSVDGRSIHAGVLLPGPIPEVDPTVLARVSSHFAASARLRRRLEGKKKIDEAEAIIDARGQLAHATGPAKRARAQIVEAATTLSRLRRSRRDPERAVSQWKALVDARWSLVVHFERDGKHVLLAERNEPLVGGIALLSERERQVVALAALGNANKMIAYELGISVSTVGVLLARAAKRLGVRSRKKLVDAYEAGRHKA